MSGKPAKARKTDDATFSDKKVVTQPDVISCDLDDSVVILNPKEGIYYSLEAVGYRIWSLVQDPVSIEEIEMAIMDEYDVEHAVCSADVARILNQLLEKDLVELQP